MKIKFIAFALSASSIFALATCPDACGFDDYFWDPAEKVAAQVKRHIDSQEPFVLSEEKLQYILDTDAAKITHLKLTSCGDTLPETLRSFSNLQKLDLSNTEIANLEGIDTLKKLEELNLNNCKELGNDDLQILIQLPRLRALSLENTHITELPKLAALEKLSLKKCKNMTSLESLSALTNLTWLDISFIPRLYDNPGRGVEPLQSLENLDYLITCERIRALPSFRTLANVKNVDVQPDIRFTLHKDPYCNGYSRVTINGSFRIPNCTLQ